MKGNPAFINEFDLGSHWQKPRAENSEPETALQALPGLPEHSYRVDNLLDTQEVQALTEAVMCQKWVAVGGDGIRAHYHKGDPIGSWRLSTYDEPLAELLYQRLRPHYPQVREMDGFSVEVDGHPRWSLVGVNPLLRFIRYEGGGRLIPHYDAPYIASDMKRSLASLVIYLTDNGLSGATRFIYDPQRDWPVAAMDLSDHAEMAPENKVIAQVPAQSGQGLVFDHRLLHDGCPLNEGERKLIIRTDLMFEAI